MKWVLADAINMALDEKKERPEINLSELVDEIWNEMQMQNEEGWAMMTVEMLTKALAENNWKATRFVCDDGNTLTVTPCSYVDITDIKDVEYFLVEDGMLPWLGGNKPEVVVHDINNHSKLIAESEVEKDQVRKFFDDHQKTGWDDESWGWYSDWHKDVFGYRPHGRVCGEYVSPY